MNVVVGFSKPKKFSVVSQMIQWFQGTNFSHVYLEFELPGMGVNLIFHATSRRVHFTPSSKFHDKNTSVHRFHLDTPKSVRRRLIGTCLHKLDIRYGFMQIFGILLSKLFNLQQNPFKHGYICSELVSEVLKEKGIHFKKNINLLTPKDVYNKMVECYSID